MSKPNNPNIVLGAGYLRFAPYDANGDPQGRRYIGQTPGFTISGSTERATKYSSDGPTAELIRDITTQVDRSASITADDISDENLALFLMGSVQQISQTSGSATDERHTVDQGLWYQLGASATDFTGARSVSNVSVTIDPDGAATSATAGDDYTVDLETGLLYVVPGGGISDGTEIGVDYDEASATWPQIETDNLGPKEGLLHFEGDNNEGENRDVVIPKCTLTPNGDMAWKSRDTFQQMQYDVRISKRDGMEQIYVNGRPA